MEGRGSPPHLRGVLYVGLISHNAIPRLPGKTGGSTEHVMALNSVTLLYLTMTRQVLTLSESQLFKIFLSACQREDVTPPPQNPHFYFFLLFKKNLIKFIGG